MVKLSTGGAPSAEDRSNVTTMKEQRSPRQDAERAQCELFCPAAARVTPAGQHH